MTQATAGRILERLYLRQPRFALPVVGILKACRDDKQHDYVRKVIGDKIPSHIHDVNPSEPLPPIIGTEVDPKWNSDNEIIS